MITNFIGGTIMEHVLAITLSLAWGAGLGYIFFWGLWKTVQRMTTVRHPYLWMFSSFIIRTGIVVLGLYLLLLIQWQLIAVALMGFIFARFAVTRHTVNKSESINSST